MKEEKTTSGSDKYRKSASLKGFPANANSLHIFLWKIIHTSDVRYDQLIRLADRYFMAVNKYKENPRAAATQDRNNLFKKMQQNSVTWRTLVTVLHCLGAVRFRVDIFIEWPWKRITKHSITIKHPHSEILTSDTESYFGDMSSVEVRSFPGDEVSEQISEPVNDEN